MFIQMGLHNDKLLQIWFLLKTFSINIFLTITILVFIPIEFLKSTFVKLY